MKLKRIVAAVLAVLSVCVCFTSCLKRSGNLLGETTAITGQPATAPTGAYPSVTAAPVTDPTAYEPSSAVPSYTTAAPETTTSPSVPVSVPTTAVQETPQTTSPAEKDPSQWSKTEILEHLTSAINTAKAFTGNMKVEHTEAFTFTITKCPGGSLGVSIANRIASGVLRPTTETLEYSGGTTVDSDGETVPLLLPKRQKFSLPAAGVQSAKAYKNGENTVIDVTLVPETSTLDSIPKYNSGALGYLDAASLDLSIVTVKTFNATYSGSTISVVIGPDGRVQEATYFVPLMIDASGSAIGITGEFACEGSQKEIWKLIW